MNAIRLLDVVNLPDEHLLRGQVGTVAEELDPDIYEVEFSDAASGHIYAMLPLSGNQLLPLHYAPTGAA